MLVLLSTLALVLAIAAPRWLDAGQSGRLERWESTLRRRGPLAVALVSVAVIWFTWDALAPIAAVHDESSYLLQADIFARFRWTVPSPPIPDFFEQPHVLTVPAVASKYPPGHALLLTIGALVGFRALVPLLLTGITAALVFALAARLTDPWTALLTWLAWLTAPLVLRFQPSFLSELTMTPLVLASWWCLLDWGETHRRPALLLMALAIGWGAITRPLTMLAFAIPIGVLVVRDTARLKLWRDFALAVAIGVSVLAVLPLWSWRTTGDWRVSPIALYRQDYLPFDKLGFTPDTTAPRRAASPVMKKMYAHYLAARKQQSLARLPETAGSKAWYLLESLFRDARLPLAAFALLGLLATAGAAGSALRFGAISVATVFVSYLPYAGEPPWTLYYLECAPLMAFVIAAGVLAASRRVTTGGAKVSVVLATVAVALFALPSIEEWRLDHRKRTAFDRAFSEHLSRLPSRHAIVFVRYSPRVVLHISEVFNFADQTSAPVWVVHDLGVRNDELRRLAPDRASFDFDEDQLVAGLRRP